MSQDNSATQPDIDCAHKGHNHPAPTGTPQCGERSVAAAEKKRHVFVKVRCRDQAEKQSIIDTAAELGVTISDLLRGSTRRPRRRNTAPAGTTHYEDPAVVRILRAAAYNLNQLAKRANSGERVSLDDIQADARLLLDYIKGRTAYFENIETGGA